MTSLHYRLLEASVDMLVNGLGLFVSDFAVKPRLGQNLRGTQGKAAACTPVSMSTWWRERGAHFSLWDHRESQHFMKNYKMLQGSCCPTSRQCTLSLARFSQQSKAGTAWANQHPIWETELGKWIRLYAEDVSRVVNLKALYITLVPPSWIKCNSPAEASVFVFFLMVPGMTGCPSTSVALSCSYWSLKIRLLNRVRKNIWQGSLHCFPGSISKWRGWEPSQIIEHHADSSSIFACKDLIECDRLEI